MSQLEEVSAKLKLKTHEFDILASSEKKTPMSESPNPPMSTCVKQEPVTMVNVPSSTNSKRPTSDPSRIPTKRVKKGGFTCDECLFEWAQQIIKDFNGDANHLDAPDPHTNIQSFSSSEELKVHYQQAHSYYFNEKFCDQPDCLHSRSHTMSDDKAAYPHGGNICGFESSDGNICGRSFRYKEQLEEHRTITHAEIGSKTREEIFKSFELIEGRNPFFLK